MTILLDGKLRSFYLKEFTFHQIQLHKQILKEDHFQISKS